MKKVLLGVVGLLLVLAIVVGWGIMSINPLVVKAVETLGPQFTGAPVRLASSNISVWSGAGELNGLFIGNPAGFKSESAFTMDGVRIVLDKTSIGSDTLIIKEISIDAPKITYELRGKLSNIKAIENNVRAAAGDSGGSGSGAGADASGGGDGGAQTKIIIENFILNEGDVTLAVTGLGGKVLTVSMPNLHLKGIGRKQGGASPAEVFGVVFQELSASISKVASKGMGDFAIGLTGGTKDDVKKIGEGIKNLFQ